MYPVDKLFVLCTDVLGGGLQFVFCFYLGLGTFPWTIADQIVCTLCWGDGLQFSSRTRAQKCEWQREIQLKIGTHLEQKMRKIVATPWSERFKIIFLVWSLLQDFTTRFASKLDPETERKVIERNRSTREAIYTPTPTGDNERWWWCCSVPVWTDAELKK